MVGSFTLSNIIRSDDETLFRVENTEFSLTNTVIESLWSRTFEFDGTESYSMPFTNPYSISHIHVTAVHVLSTNC